MHGKSIFMYYPRFIEKEVIRSLKNNPVTAIIGSRQSGKSTMAHKLVNQLTEDHVFLDLERHSDLSALDNAEWFFKNNKGKLICLDEIQRKPEIFPLIRSLVDEWGDNGHFLVLGSASRDLIKQSSETLAGRISYKKLNPFNLTETKGDFSIEDYIIRGGFPRSLLRGEEVSLEWREDFISTFLERDLMQWSGFSTLTMRKLWRMLAVENGNIVNYNRLACSLGISAPTVKNHIELLAATFMLNILPPYLPNIGKRLIKSPKIYLNDIGISNALLGIGSFNELSSHPSKGTAWETLVLSNLMSVFPNYEFSFYRTSHGAEIDIILRKGRKIIAVECKSSSSPKLTKGGLIALKDINPDFTLVICPVDKIWQISDNIYVGSITDAINKIQESS